MLSVNNIKQGRIFKMSDNATNTFLWNQYDDISKWPVYPKGNAPNMDAFSPFGIFPDDVTNAPLPPYTVQGQDNGRLYPGTLFRVEKLYYDAMRTAKDGKAHRALWVTTQDGRTGFVWVIYAGVEYAEPAGVEVEIKANRTATGTLSVEAKSIGMVARQLDQLEYSAPRPLETDKFFATNKPLFAPPREGNTVKCYVDGKQAFADIAEAMNVASEYIYITDWGISPNFLLTRKPSSEQSLVDIISNAVQRGVLIRILLWDSADKTPFANVNNYDIEAEKIFEAIDPAKIKVLRHSPALKWSHHQKSVVIDGKVAFLGGLDIFYGRWDTPEHQLDASNQNPLFLNEEYYQPTIKDADREKHPRLPWHDIHTRIEGPAVWDVEQNFVLRWAKHSDNGEQLARQSSPSDPPGTTKVQIVRSICEDSGGHQGTERGILEVYLRAIAGAKSSIHIEQQFFTSYFGTSTVQNRFAQALGDRIIKAIGDKALFRVSIVIPLYPESILNESSGSQEVLHWELQTINRGGGLSLLPRLRAKVREVYGTDKSEQEIDKLLSKYINIFYLRNYGRINDQYVTSQIYVHAKTIIVDDKVAIIGSANINDRSLLGDRDSEISAVIVDDNLVHDLRMRLWAEHLGLTSTNGIENATSNAAYENILLSTAVRNTESFLSAFPGIARNEFTTFNEQAAASSGIIITSKLNEIKGHIMLYPLNWLSKENLESWIVPDNVVV